jgi:hypothetical protein
MLSHSARSHLPTNGRTASDHPLTEQSVSFRWDAVDWRVAGGEIRRHLSFRLYPAVLCLGYGSRSSGHMGNVGLDRSQ